MFHVTSLLYRLRIVHLYLERNGCFCKRVQCNRAAQLYPDKTSPDLYETGPNSVRISRNKLGYYSGLAVVPNDVVIALETGASVGKAGENKGGSRYQERVAEAEREWSCSDVVDVGSSTRVCRRQLGRPAFAYWLPFSSFPCSSLAWPALPAMQGLTPPSFSHCLFLFLVLWLWWY